MHQLAPTLLRRQHQARVDRVRPHGPQRGHQPGALRLRLRRSARPPADGGGHLVGHQHRDAERLRQELEPAGLLAQHALALGHRVRLELGARQRGDAVDDDELDAVVDDGGLQALGSGRAATAGRGRVQYGPAEARPKTAHWGTRQRAADCAEPALAFSNVQVFLTSSSLSRSADDFGSWTSTRSSSVVSEAGVGNWPGKRSRAICDSRSALNLRSVSR